ncbi:MAG TPA: AAA family ATPase [Panacibacter sp.]|nr:AAA family ATPase [Panacibacter sp.]
MDNLNNQKLISSNNMFEGYFLEIRTLYLHCFNIIPSRFFIDHINGEKAFRVFKETYKELIADIHMYRWFDHGKKQYLFDKTVIIMKNQCIVELDTRHCQILHDGQHDSFVEEGTTLVKKFKERERKEPAEINLIVRDGASLYLKSIEINRTKLELDLFYEDEFKNIDETIRARLNRKKDKGIVLLHGLPGTGKTTYLRYLIGKIKKRVLFLSPNVAGNLMDPQFIELLIDNPNTVIIIEDAENIIMDRRNSADSSASNLLNISDGLLADFLNVQIICTFNSSLTLVDSALMRKGRLIAKYEFGKLSINKAQRLSNHLGFDTIIHKAMTVAEISNQHEQNFDTKQVQVIGFRRESENGDFGGLN